MSRAIITTQTTVTVSVTVTDEDVFQKGFQQVKSHMPDGYTADNYLTGLAHRAAVRNEPISHLGVGVYTGESETKIVEARFGDNIQL